MPAAAATSTKATLLGCAASEDGDGPRAEGHRASPPNIASRLAVSRRVILDVRVRCRNFKSPWSLSSMLRYRHRYLTFSNCAFYNSLSKSRGRKSNRLQYHIPQVP